MTAGDLVDCGIVGGHRPPLQFGRSTDCPVPIPMRSHACRTVPTNWAAFGPRLPVEARHSAQTITSCPGLIRQQDRSFRPIFPLCFSREPVSKPVVQFVEAIGKALRVHPAQKARGVVVPSSGDRNEGTCNHDGMPLGYIQVTETTPASDRRPVSRGLPLSIPSPQGSGPSNTRQYWA